MKKVTPQQITIIKRVMATSNKVSYQERKQYMLDFGILPGIATRLLQYKNWDLLSPKGKLELIERVDKEIRKQAKNKNVIA